ncbi:transposase [Streptomyces noursei]|uniref:transposase n=1 Tax=Streptomyces noursei TaxID=1971 RepID=UPI001F2F89DB|nr:transposase [Streptomyces noursei]
MITAWKGRHPSVSGHKGNYGMREIVNALLYQAKTGCQWRYFPHGLPSKSAVYYYFGLWRDDGTAETIHELLRRLAREMRRRREQPTVVVLDSQTVRASVNAPKETTGLDPGKRSPGRKRGIATDVIGLVIAVIVVAPSVHDNAIGITLLDKVADSAPTVTKVWGGTPRSRRPSWSMAPASASTWRSCTASRIRKGSPRRRSSGWSSRLSAPSCCTDVSCVTTRPDRPARRPGSTGP